MSSNMRDASTITKLKQSRALYAYNAQRSAAVIAGQTVKPESSVSSNDLLNMRREGAQIKFDAREPFTRGCACTTLDCSGSTVCLPPSGSEH